MGMPFVVPGWVLIPVMVIGYTVFDILLETPVAWLGHVGGFVGGVLVAAFLRNRPVPDVFLAIEQRRRERIEEVMH